MVSRETGGSSRTAESRQAREQARGTVRQQREQRQAARGMLAQRAGAPAVAPPAVAAAKVERTRQGPQMSR